MSDDKWKLELRNMMEDYEETAPEGLLEGVEAVISAKRRRAAALRRAYVTSIAAAVAAVAMVWIFGSHDTGSIDLVHDNAPATTAMVETEEPEEDVLALLNECAAETPGGVPDAIRPGSIVPSPIERILETAVQDTEPTTEPETGVVEAAVKSQEAGNQGFPGAARPDDSASENTVAEWPEETLQVLNGSKRQNLHSGSRVRASLSFAGSGNFGQERAFSFSGYGLSNVLATKSPEDGETVPSLAAISRNKASSTDVSYSQSARYTLTANIGVSDRWGVETGLVLTRLHSSSTSTAGTMSSMVEKESSYLGIPLFLRFTPLAGKVASLYVSAGPMYEFCNSTKSSIRYFSADSLLSENSASGKDDDRQWSLNAGAGIQIRILPHGALFMQPGVSWHMPSEGAPESFYTENPLSLSIAFGYRLLLGGN